jgi:hypothetical protein
MWSNVISDPIMPHFIIKLVEIWIVVSFYWKVWHLFWVLQFINLCQNYVTWNDFEKNWFENHLWNHCTNIIPTMLRDFHLRYPKVTIHLPYMLLVVLAVILWFQHSAMCWILSDNDIIFRKRHSFHLLLKYLHS